MQIRLASPEDAALLSDIAVAAKGYWGYSPATMQSWAKDLRIEPAAIQSNPTFVAETDTVAGFYMLSHEERVWELEHLWVTPTHMRRGIGKALMSHALSTIRSHDGAVLCIDADPNAEAFYLACGARRVGEAAAPITEDPKRIRPLLEIILGE